MSRFLWLWLALWPTVLTSTAWACPLCDSETAKEVRAGIFNSDFASTALLTLLPFPILLSMVGLIYFGAPPWGKADHDDLSD